MSDKQPLPTGPQLTAADPVFREHPHEYLDRLRTEDPVHRDAKLGRLFLTRFEDVRAVVSNRALSVDRPLGETAEWYDDRTPLSFMGRSCPLFWGQNESVSESQNC